MKNDKDTSASLENARKKAEKLIHEREKLFRFLDKTAEKAAHNRGKLRKVWDDLELLIAMIRAYKSGIYRKVPWKSIVLALFALIYFVNPLDIIPDFLGLFGFVDDATVIGLVMNALRDEVEEFRAFLKAGSAE